ncbi:MAG: HypC/HybG/HupF family hydrogenase formation chaperone [Gammaproteobacteria bacterium]|nr:HypC/HybG/HupF family hydrogenase formation chaperone [Gammaproteobacteria bacterium]MDH4255304.1 HypC/HybG/HupF family hydrogenase formation chaperone [Gammaproteobacteria bacterium]MDH5273125.1 HypC/HybG/HupF family hydrogenase formation chaperone [Gammaproteobacteria bacterium]
MCLAVPARVTALDRATASATVSLGGVQKDISVALLDSVDVDDYVLVHVGYALNRISAEEARITLELMAEAGLPTDGEAYA